MEAAEAMSQADRWRNIEEQLKRQQEQAQRQQEQIDRLTQQQSTTGLSQPQMVEAAFDGTGAAPSNRKSSVASTQLQGDDDDDDAPPMMHPVDDITEMTPCELHVKVVNNITIKAAVGYAKPIDPEPTHHGLPEIGRAHV